VGDDHLHDLPRPGTAGKQGAARGTIHAPPQRRSHASHTRSNQAALTRPAGIQAPSNARAPPETQGWAGGPPAAAQVRPNVCASSATQFTNNQGKGMPPLAGSRHRYQQGLKKVARLTTNRTPARAPPSRKRSGLAEDQISRAVAGDHEPISPRSRHGQASSGPWPQMLADPAENKASPRSQPARSIPCHVRVFTTEAPSPPAL